MADYNYFVSYDLNGSRPSHTEMDTHLKKLGPCVLRVLETVWFIRSSKNLTEVYAYMQSILSMNDRALVIWANQSTFRNLLVPDETVLRCWVK